MTLKEATDLIRPSFDRPIGMSSGEYQSAKTWTAFYALVRAYLAEHPADEDEPADHDWLISVGFIAIGDADDCPARVAIKGNGQMVTVLIGLDVSDLVLNCMGISEDPTRGDVRRLCKALGIEMGEGE